MAIQLVAATLQLEGLTPSQKLVLLVYANYADEDGFAFPSVPTVARQVGLSERQTRRLVHQLRDAGVLEESGKTQYRGRTVNLYRFTGVVTHVPPVVDVRGEGGDDAELPLTSVSATPDMGVSQTVIEPSSTPSPQTSSSDLSRVRAGLFEAFFEFVYQRSYEEGEAIPKTERGRLNSAVLEAVEAGITPEEVRKRGKRWSSVWPGLARSAQALLANWSLFGDRAAEDDDGPIDPATCDHLWQTWDDGVSVCVRCRFEEWE